MIAFFLLFLKILIAAYMAAKLAFVALFGAFCGGVLRRLRQLRRESGRAGSSPRSRSRPSGPRGATKEAVGRKVEPIR